MLVGRTLMSKLKDKEKFVIALNLIQDPKTGKKIMNKSEGDAVWLNDSANEMFGKILALPDSAIIPMLLGTTHVSMEQIKKYEKDLKNGKNPKEVKIILAKEIIKIYHSEKEADAAEENFENTFKKDAMPNDTVVKTIEANTLLSDFLVKENIVKSKTEFRRLINDGAIKDVSLDQKITDPNFVLQDSIDLKIGKKTFLKICVVV